MDSFVIRFLIAILAIIVPTLPGFAAMSQPYVGAQQCRTCHAHEYEMWKMGPHANALKKLSSKDRQNPLCMQCHTMLPKLKSERFAGVQCESCHGAGRYYSLPYVMKDKELSKRLHLNEPDEKTCLRCHTGSGSKVMAFDYHKKQIQIGHWHKKLEH